MRTAIVEGIATILWCSAWAQHVDEHHCCRLSGCRIEDHAPEAPDQAYAHARAVVASVEAANGMSVSALYRLACDVHGPGAASATRFGECMAYAAMGDGVSWFDDHAGFDLEIPYCASNAAFDLQCHADETCELAPVYDLAAHRARNVDRI